MIGFLLLLKNQSFSSHLLANSPKNYSTEDFFIETTTEEINTSDAEVISGTTAKNNFEGAVYMGLFLILLILIIFLVWKYFSSRKHVHNGDTSEAITVVEPKTDKIASIIRQSTPDVLKIEVEENSDSEHQKEAEL